ncbi:aminotransferase class I/II-fold pyridoxal phosphate-dependent enzyme [Lactobacillus sp. UCMA15818]|uniref:pyridoxal phosphate-dependent aminotransferase n=1 Tax=Lactobacillus sp. UCMA15818 TaxID=2583394 RepID=UPI0025AFD296|nr:aminotransferase class I/II-fold pyridoxal phosphate-dependent enzyme [Lactobacillus sp. UCMA15818]MDN2454422.1 aminotransferase class I/II-fold pyridoxal phosphate-dependent enzyme [Lactobacillus sp. UCMA15818]
MKSINKFVKVAKQSGIRHISDFTDDLTDIIQLTVGEIDLPTPENTKQAGIQAIKNNYTKYTSNRGTEALRKAIATFADTHYGMKFDWRKEIIVTVGASEGIDLALRTLCNVGDEVVIAAPAYPAYVSSTIIAGAKPAFVDTTKTNFKMTADALEAVITPQTKVVILNYPNNPTGTILNQTELLALAKVIIKHDLYVITDDVYDLIVYNSSGQAQSIVTLPNMRERTIVLNGVSKSHSMTGWRIGYVLASMEIIDQMFKVHQTNVGTATSISQIASIAALEQDADNPQKLVKIFKVRKEIVTTALDEMGLTYVDPQGAFYIFVNINNLKISSWEFSIKLIQDYKLAVVPGSAFSADGYVRISYAADKKILTEAMKRLKKAVNDLKTIANS